MASLYRIHALIAAMFKALYNTYTGQYIQARRTVHWRVILSIKSTSNLVVLYSIFFLLLRIDRPLNVIIFINDLIKVCNSYTNPKIFTCSYSKTTTHFATSDYFKTLRNSPFWKNFLPFLPKYFPKPIWLFTKFLYTNCSNTFAR